MNYRIPIEIKSLFFNIKNDNERGHTATVSSILRQCGSVHEDVAQIKSIPENIKSVSREGIINKILRKSRAEAKINRVCCFDKVSVNGLPINTDYSFCIYIREETSEEKIHYGRQRIHYPLSLSYSDDYIDIDNRKILQGISKILNDYAFVIEAFEYNANTGYLNFDAIIVGPKEIPYSKVFVNRKGVGSKFTYMFEENYDDYDTEIIALRRKLGYENVGPENFKEIMHEQKDNAYKDVIKYLSKKGIDSCKDLYKEYPYSIYDFEYKINGIKYFGIIKHSATLLKKFVLSYQQFQFINQFNNYATIFLETDVLGRKKIYELNKEQIVEAEKQIRSLVFDISEV